MLNAMLSVITYLLAAYGALCLIMSIADAVRQRVNQENSGIKLVLMVKNQEEFIEGVIRNIFMGDFLRKVMSGRRLSVVNMGSEDSTPEILDRLKEYYGEFDVIEENEKESIFKDFQDS